MKATYIYVVLAMAISTLAATTPIQNDNRVQAGNNRFGGFGRGGQNGQQNKGSANQNNQNGKSGNNSNNKNAGAGAANTGSVRTANGSNQGQNQNQNQNNGAAAGGAANSTASAGAAAGGAANSADAQTSLTLDPAVIAKGFASDGQETPEAGQVASLTSTNNFINFCLTANGLPITNGQQIATGSCNPAPMGIIPSTSNMPSAKFVFPKNGDTVQENTAFTIQMAIQNMQTGAFVNANANYFSAPQQTNAQGQIIGHSHVVVEALSALDQTTPTDPRKFAFFKGLNAAAVNGVLTADVTSGLPAGVYKLSSINTAANHQPVLVPIAQHGSLDDAVYFTVSANGAASNGTAAAGAAGAANGAGAAAGATGAAGAANGAGAAAGAAGAGAAAGGAAGAAAGQKGAANNQNQNQNQGNKAQSGAQRNANGNNRNQNQGQRNRGRRFGRQIQF